ncbi:GNAT family N-acetyltransferase [Citricoccus sp. NPDC079358]|jgi:ribosomal protein S18 acetylase RimI-like enzyme|uniref:GNAT family N-acetyltransferase n=1 Tax=Citricoccus sp. NPDC079358 TaxID=3154653 RepID=UPI003450C7AB
MVERSTALAFIVACQQDPATGTAFLGEDAAGIEAELDGLDQPWLRNLRVVEQAGTIIAACTVDWDPEPSMAWVHGPWGAPEQVARHGAALVADVCDAVPAGIDRFEMCGQVENESMAGLAAGLGWTATEVNYAMVVPAATAARWSAPAAPAGQPAGPAGPAGQPAPARLRTPVRIRPAESADVGLLKPLHTAEFGEAYATAAQLLSRHHTVVAEDSTGAVLGYAAGSLQDDGQAYVDFTAVLPGARRRGVGRRLVTGLAERLLAAGDPGMLHLTVRESRPAAHALYLSLGMRQEAALRGYRGPRVTAQHPG